MWFSILGPPEVRCDGRAVELGGRRQRAVLAVLLLHANEIVLVERLIDWLWDDAPPRTARAVVHSYVSRLRAALRRCGREGRSPLITTAAGYLIEVEPERFDLHRFERSVERARVDVAAGRLEEAADGFREALGMWRGPALAGIAGEGLSARLSMAATRLEERRRSVLEERLEVDLALGRHVRLAAELEELTADQPLRERLWALWMLALYRSGRQADALQVYRRLRTILVEELGLEPTAAVRELHQSILTADPVLDQRLAPSATSVPHAAWPTPRQLPPDVATFVGRGDELGYLDKLLRPAGRHAAQLIAIIGQAGIGKSALAIRAAHDHTERFPDGTLYVDLQGSTRGLAPLDASEVLSRFLRAFGVDGTDVPLEVQERAALFRSLLAGRSALLVLDNAVTAAQVRPLLPASPGCAVLITSRWNLGDLDGVTQLHLDVLSLGAAFDLLGSLAGPERVAAEPAATHEVVGLCGALPLALRIAGARLAARPGWPVNALAARLADQHRRLDELRLGDLAVRVSFQVTYEALLRDSADDAQTFRLLGLLDGPDLGVATAAVLLEQDNATAHDTMERLVDAQLLRTATPGRYRFHDLLRLFARDHAHQDEPEDQRDAALTRVLRWLLATTRQADRFVRPGQPTDVTDAEHDDDHPLRFDDREAVLAWLEAERGNLVAAARQAAASPGIPAHIPGQLMRAVSGFLYLRSHWTDWEQLGHTLLAHARARGDLADEAYFLNDLGIIANHQDRSDEALQNLQQSLTIRGQIGDRPGQAVTLNNLGIVHWGQRQYDQAATCYEQSLALFAELGDRYRQAATLNNLSDTYREQHRYDDASDRAQRCIALAREIDDPRLEGVALHNLGDVHCRQGRYDDAVACYERSVPLLRQTGDRHAEGLCLDGLGEAHHLQGDHDQAIACHRQSLQALREAGTRHEQATALWHLGNAFNGSGDPHQAAACWRDALATFEEIGAPEAAELRTLLHGSP